MNYLDRIFEWLDKLIDKFIKNKKMNAMMKKLLNKETILYLVFGVLTTVVALVSFYFVDKLFDRTGFMGKYGYQGANVISWILAVTFAYITNKLWVFESKSFAWHIIRKEIPSFAFSRLLTLGIETLGMFLLVTVLDLNKMLSKILVSIIVVILNYIFSKILVFKSKKK
ncbi:hypothetical protein SDC9_199615 [bioreactor metagenome]|uniref:GtrA/DPMS transmembrane domain-containing protein n=1 Tax=bioreactor metagenome TaxID=1076179 RepID=A0A645IXN2_9ZZZZ